MEKLNVAQKLIQMHLIEGSLEPGDEIALKVDHILQQDATGTLVMLEPEKLGLDRVQVEVAVQYVDHNLLQTDFKNADDHTFLQSAAKIRLLVQSPRKRNQPRGAHGTFWETRKTLNRIR